MSRRRILAALTTVLLAVSFPVVAQKKDQKKDEPRKQDSAREQSRLKELGNRALKKWLDEDVAYIITDAERAAFKKLQTDEEREQFIEQFWLRRDPTPDTLENEFKEDHYARIAYANERFASGIPGWKTDRGRFYIMYGPPDEIESHPSGGTYTRPFEEGGGTTSTFPFETWRYRYLENIGTNVIFEFVDPSMSGEYRFTIDPSEKDALLHVPGAGLTDFEQQNGGDKTDRFNRSDGTHLGAGARYNAFDQLDLMVKAFRPPEVKFKDLETVVTTKLSFNTLPFTYRADFIRVVEDSVLTPISVQIQYKDLAFQEKEGIHSALAHVYGRITGVTGRLAQVFEDTITQDIPDALFKRSLETPARYQKVVTLRPGLYKLDLVVKDINSGNIGTINKSFSVPRIPDGKLATSSLILADNVEPLPPRQIASGMHILGSQKVLPNVKQEFRHDQNMNVWLQVYNLKVDEGSHKPSAKVEMLITREGREVKKIVEDATELSSAAQQLTLTKAVPLSDLDPGEYAIQVKVTDNLTNEVIPTTSKFSVR